MNMQEQAVHNAIFLTVRRPIVIASPQAAIAECTDFVDFELLEKFEFPEKKRIPTPDQPTFLN